MVHYTIQTEADGGRKEDPSTIPWEGGADFVPRWAFAVMVYGREKTLGVEFGKDLVLPEDHLGRMHNQGEMVQVVVDTDTKYYC